MGYAPVIVYVPSEYYREYAAIHEPYFIDIYKANVCYYFNIDENDYYYVDYYEEGSLIEFIPPIPIKAKWFVVLYGLLELLFIILQAQDGVAHFAHLGGMFFGWLLLTLWNRRDRNRFYHN